MNKLYRISTSIYSEQLTNWQRRSNSGRLALENLNPLFVFTANILNILLYDGQSAECKIHVTENAKMQSAIYPRAESRKDMQIYSARVWRFGRKKSHGSTLYTLVYIREIELVINEIRAHIYMDISNFASDTRVSITPCEHDG